MTEKEIFQMYNEIDIGKNSICKNCNENESNLSIPVSIWQVGKFFNCDDFKILFVGKNARGRSEERNSNFYDGTKTADDLINYAWPYWSYTKAIIESVYPNSDVNAWEKVAFTNIVKCNNSNSTDKTTAEIKDNCILKLQVLKKEISILKPNYIVFYTGRHYDYYIQKAFDVEFDVYQRKLIGFKNIIWSEFNIFENGHTSICLRTGHPERTKKDDFVSSIVEWIKQHPVYF